MAKGNNIYAAQRCKECNMIIKTIWFRKAKFKPADLAFTKFCKHCQARTVTSVKEIKKAA